MTSCAVGVVTKWNALSQQLNATASSTTAATQRVKTALLWSTRTSVCSWNQQFSNLFFTWLHVKLLCVYLALMLYKMTHILLYSMLMFMY